MSKLVIPAVPVHGHWDPVVPTAEVLQWSVGQAVEGPWGWGKDRDTLVGSYQLVSWITLLLLEEGVNVDLLLISFNVFLFRILDDFNVHPKIAFIP